MNENTARAVDHVVVMVINCAAVAGFVWLVMNGHPWMSLLCCLFTCKSSSK